MLGLFSSLALLWPLLFGTGGTTATLEQVFAFAAFAMSYDLLIGYTGIISFGHAMFFGTGAYVVAIALARGNGHTISFLFGFGLAVVGAVVLSLLVAFISLRVRNAYFAMITLAVGQVFAVMAGSQGLRQWTHGNDGLTFSVPNWLNGDLTLYYLCLFFLFLTSVLLTRFVASPVGHVLRGIRENESRAVGLGLGVVQFKTLAFVVSGVTATLAGGVYALAQSFVSTGVYDVSGISLNVLLMVVIGGVGTLYGGVLGAAVLVGVQNLFSNWSGWPLLTQHEMLWFGILYILIVRFLPQGILGSVVARGGVVSWRALPRFKKSQT